MKLVALGVVIACALGAQGCLARNHLVFTTYTKVGLDVSTENGKPTQAVLGYKRFEGALIPVEPTGGDEDPKCMSVFAASAVDNSWIMGLEIQQIFATGKAAVNAASDPKVPFASLIPDKKKKEAE